MKTGDVYLTDAGSGIRFISIVGEVDGLGYARTIQLQLNHDAGLHSMNLTTSGPERPFEHMPHWKTVKLVPDAPIELSQFEMATPMELAEVL